MAQNVNPTFVKTPTNGLVQISTGSGTGTVVAYTGGASGSKIVGMMCTSQSTGAVNVRFGIANGGTTYYLGEAAVPVGSGFTSATISVALFGGTVAPLPFDSDGNPFVILKSSADTMVCSAETTLVSGVLNIVTIAGDF